MDCVVSDSGRVNILNMLEYANPNLTQLINVSRSSLQRPYGNVPQSISKLIISKSMFWNETLVQTLFSPEIVTQICCIPLNLRCPAD